MSDTEKQQGEQPEKIDLEKFNEERREKSKTEYQERRKAFETGVSGKTIEHKEKQYAVKDTANILSNKGRISGVIEQGQKITILNDGKTKTVNAKGDITSFYDDDVVKNGKITMVKVKTDKYEGWIPVDMIEGMKKPVKKEEPRPTTTSEEVDEQDKSILREFEKEFDGVLRDITNQTGVNFSKQRGIHNRIRFTDFYGEYKGEKKKLLHVTSFHETIGISPRDKLYKKLADAKSDAQAVLLEQTNTFKQECEKKAKSSPTPTTTPEEMDEEDKSVLDKFEKEFDGVLRDITKSTGVNFSKQRGIHNRIRFTDFYGEYKEEKKKLLHVTSFHETIGISPRDKLYKKLADAKSDAQAVLLEQTNTFKQECEKKAKSSPRPTTTPEKVDEEDKSVLDEFEKEFDGVLRDITNQTDVNFYKQRGIYNRIRFIDFYGEYKGEKKKLLRATSFNKTIGISPRDKLYTKVGDATFDAQAVLFDQAESFRKECEQKAKHSPQPVAEKPAMEKPAQKQTKDLAAGLSDKPLEDKDAARKALDEIRKRLVSLSDDRIKSVGPMFGDTSSFSQFFHLKLKTGKKYEIRATADADGAGIFEINESNVKTLRDRTVKFKNASALTREIELLIGGDKL